MSASVPVCVGVGVGERYDDVDDDNNDGDANSIHPVHQSGCSAQSCWEKASKLVIIK